MYLKMKQLLERLTGFSIHRNNTPWGYCVSNDLRRVMHDWRPRTIFDVGANIGQSALKFASDWPQAEILSFEPVSKTFYQLNNNVSQLKNVRAFQLGFSDTMGKANIKLFPNSELASLDHDVNSQQSSGFEEIAISTIDHFAMQNNLETIDILKIDTEGLDLKVIAGAEGLLSAGKIKILVAETASMPVPGKVDLLRLSQALRKHEMICIGMYDQNFVKREELWYANAVYLHASVIN